MSVSASQTNTITAILRRAKKAAEEQRRASPFIRADDDDEEYVPVGVQGLLQASRRLLQINRGVARPDERDSRIYSRVYSPADLIKERIQLDSGHLRRNIMNRLKRSRSLKSLPQRPFEDYFEKFIIGQNPLSLPLEEINPLHIADQRRRISGMGEGGLPSREVVTESMQSIHPTEFGFLSPLEGPEDTLIGIDTRAAWGTRIGSDGNIYQRFRNRKTGDEEWLSPVDLDGSRVMLPR